MTTYTQADVLTLGNGKHHFDDGLYLNVSGNARSWAYKYGFGGKPYEMGLGSAKDLKLVDARKERLKWASVRARGENPIEVRRKQLKTSKAETNVLTFKAATASWIGTKGSTWTNEDYEDQVEHSLRDYAYSTIGDLPLTEIKRSHVLDLLRPIWHKKPVVAERVRQRIQAVFAHAMHVDEDLALRNPAEFEAIEGALGKQASRDDSHHASLPFDKMPAFIVELRARPSVSARALEFVILTAVRTCEALKAKWTEIDWDTKTWTVPKERMKARKKHEVPLSPRAIEILRELRAQNPTGTYIFTSERSGSFAARGGDQPMFRTALQAQLRIMHRDNITVHGFRSSFRTWGGKMTSYAFETLEWALAHKVGNKVSRAYNDDTHLEKRRPLMNDWADYCAGKRASNVLKFQRRDDDEAA